MDIVKEPVDRLRKKLLKENLWLFLLKLLEEKDMYAYELRKAIKEKFGFWSGIITGYKVLHLLEKDLYIQSI